MQPESDKDKHMWQAMAVAIGLFPIGLLFGIVAQQNYWTWSDVLFLSVFGFSASGQFFYLKLESEQASLASIFFVVLMLNIRYVPMSLAAWNSLDSGKRLLRIVSAHFISDESFAIEPKMSHFPMRIQVRAIIFTAWILSTVLGVITGQLIPSEWISLSSQYLLFPATAILAILAAKRIDHAITHNDQFMMSKKLMLILGCASFSIGVLYVVGKDIFWIPGIIGVIGILYFSGWGEVQHD